MRRAICKIPWSGKGTSFRAHRDVTCRDQLTASCSCQTVHRRDHRHRALTNGPHQFCTGLEHVLVGFGVRSCLKRKLMIFLYDEYKKVLRGSGILRTNSFRLCPAENTFPGSDVNRIDRRSLLSSSLLISLSKIFSISNDKEFREAESLKRMVLI